MNEYHPFIPRMFLDILISTLITVDINSDNLNINGDHRSYQR